jgi:hypothetical protein
MGTDNHHLGTDNYLGSNHDHLLAYDIDLGAYIDLGTNDYNVLAHYYYVQANNNNDHDNHDNDSVHYYHDNDSVHDYHDDDSVHYHNNDSVHHYHNVQANNNASSLHQPQAHYTVPSLSLSPALGQEGDERHPLHY